MYDRLSCLILTIQANKERNIHLTGFVVNTQTKATSWIFFVKRNVHGVLRELCGGKQWKWWTFNDMAKIETNRNKRNVAWIVLLYFDVNDLFFRKMVMFLKATICDYRKYHLIGNIITSWLSRPGRNQVMDCAISQSYLLRWRIA